MAFFHTEVVEVLVFSGNCKATVFHLRFIIADVLSFYRYSNCTIKAISRNDDYRLYLNTKGLSIQNDRIKLNNSDMLILIAPFHVCNHSSISKFLVLVIVVA